MTSDVRKLRERARKTPKKTKKVEDRPASSQEETQEEETSTTSKVETLPTRYYEDDFVLWNSKGVFLKYSKTDANNKTEIVTKEAKVFYEDSEKLFTNMELFEKVEVEGKTYPTLEPVEKISENDSVLRTSIGTFSKQKDNNGELVLKPLEIYYEDDSYLCDDNGVFEKIYKKSKGGDVNITFNQLHLHPILVEKLLNDEAEDGTTYTVLRFYDIGKNSWRHHVVDRENYLNDGSLKNKTDLPSHPASRYKLETYLNQQKNQMHISGQLVRDIAYKTLGWSKDKTEFVTTAHPNYVGKEPNVYTKSGTYEEWKENYVFFCEHNPFICLLTAFHLASYVKGIVSQQQGYNALLMLHGTQGLGKSFAMKQVATIVGEVDSKTIVSHSSTNLGIANQLMRMSGGNAFIDEIEKIKQGPSDLLRIMNEDARAKSTRDGQTAYQDPFSGFITASGNEHLSQKWAYDDSSKSVYDRALFLSYEDKNILRTRPTFKDITEEDDPFALHSQIKDETKEATSKLQSNYGHLAPAVIEYVKMHQKELDQKFFDYLNEFSKNYASLGKRNRAPQLFALIQCGIDLVEIFLGDSVARMAQEQLVYLAESHDEKIEEQEKNVIEKYDELKSWIYKNIQKFIVDGPIYITDSKHIDDQRVYGQKCSERAQGSSTVFGQVLSTDHMESSTDFHGTVEIFLEGKKSVCNELEVNESELLSLLDKLGLVVKDSGRFDRKKRVNKSLKKHFKTSSIRVLKLKLYGDEWVENKLEEEEQINNAKEVKPETVLQNEESNFLSDDDDEEVEIPFDDIVVREEDKEENQDKDTPF